jgi:hypothetical protein
MPKKPIDFSKSIIYKLCCNDVSITDIYVGSTTNFIKRKYSHKSNSRNPSERGYNNYNYQFIRDNGGFENWSMIEIEKYNAIDALDLLKRERYWIDELKPTLNNKMPYKTSEEKYEVKQKITEEWRKNNRDKVLEQKRKYRENNKDIINQRNRDKYNAKKIILNIYNNENTNLK